MVTNLNQDFFHRSLRIRKRVIDTAPVFIVHETLELNSVVEETFVRHHTVSQNDGRKEMRRLRQQLPAYAPLTLCNFQLCDA
jgi:hypothetical protein